MSFAGLICRATDRTFVDLYFQHNQLEGEIPKELGNIGYLRTMKTKPGNGELTGCIVPNQVLDALRVGTSELVSTVVTLGAKKVLRGAVKTDLLEALPWVGNLLDDVAEGLSDLISGHITAPVAQFLGLGDVDDVNACEGR